MGGSTPNASAVRKITWFGCPPTLGMTAFSMNFSGYAARVFSVTSCGIEIEQARFRIHGHVFEHGAEADRVPDLRLVLPGEPDALGVTAAFEIEDAVVAPAVLVVADEAALGVGGKRRLAGAGESEEERHVARGAHVGGAVHGEDAAIGQQVVEDGEGGLLHFAGVAGAADQHDALLEIDDDAGFRVGAVLGGAGLEIGREEDGELRRVIAGFLRVGPDKKLAREEIVPGELADHADGHAVFRVGADEAILHIDVVTLPEGHHFGIQAVEVGFGERLVDVAPLHVGVGGLVAYDEFVLGRTPRELAGADDKRAAAGEISFPALDGMFQQLRRTEVPVRDIEVAEPLLLEAVTAGPDPRVRDLPVFSEHCIILSNGLRPIS